MSNVTPIDTPYAREQAEEIRAFSDELFDLLYARYVFKEVADKLRTELAEGEINESRIAFIQAALKETLDRAHNEIARDISEQSLRPEFYAANLKSSLLLLKSLHTEFENHRPAAANDHANPGIVAALG